MMYLNEKKLRKKMSSFQQRNYESQIETEKYGPYTGKEAVIGTRPWGSPDVGLTICDFQSAIPDMFKELKEALPKELKEE